MKNILMLALLLFSPLAFAQMTMPDTTATNIMLMNAATSISDTPTKPTSTKQPTSTPTEEYVTDEVTMPDGTKAFLKHKKTSPPAPKATVIYDQPSRIVKNENNGNLYIYPMTVKGTPCIVVSTKEYANSNGSYTSIAISCNWK